MKKLLFVLAIFCALTTKLAAQKNMTEGSLVYDVTVSTGSAEPQMADAFDGATTTVYIKGAKSRTETTSALGAEASIYDSKTGTAVILKEYSNQKLMITLTKENWAAKNKAYQNVTFTYANEYKDINGYKCQKAIATMANGKTFNVFFTKEVTIANTEYVHAFKNLPGLAMEYEIETAKSKIKYTIAKIDFEVVAASKFDIPTTGYRVMTYEENQAMKKKGVQ
jgi:GLPGLI family protein